MDQPEVEALLREVRSLLNGIDREECCDDDGWWETGAGAAFGAEKLTALESLLRKRLAQ